MRSPLRTLVRLVCQAIARGTGQPEPGSPGLGGRGSPAPGPALGGPLRAVGGPGGAPGFVGGRRGAGRAGRGGAARGGTWSFPAPGAAELQPGQSPPPPPLPPRTWSPGTAGPGRTGPLGCWRSRSCWGRSQVWLGQEAGRNWARPLGTPERGGGRGFRRPKEAKPGTLAEEG